MKDGWKYVKLGDVIHIKHGYGFKGEYFVKEQTKNFLLTPGNFAIGGGYKSDKIKYYDGPINEEFILKTGDVIVTMTDLSKQADTLGYSAKIPNDPKNTYLHNQRIGLISLTTNNFDLNFIYWLLRTDYYQRYVAGSSTGATVKHTSPKKIYSAKLLVPESLFVQQKIASILSGYDHLIENNLKRIKLLEEKAQLTYEEWFIRMKFPGHESVKINKETDLPEGWVSLDLNEWLKIKHGFAFKGKYFEVEPTSRILLTPGNFRIGGGVKLEKLKYYNENAEFPKDYILDKHDLLITMTDLSKKGDTLGYPMLVPSSRNDIFLHNQRLGKVLPKTDCFPKYFLRLFFQDERYRSFVVGSASGSTVKHTAPKKILSYKPNLPHLDHEIISKFDLFVEPKFKIIDKLLSQNQLLKEARDILLPRLMTGMIDVEQLEEIKEQPLRMVAEENEKYETK